MDTCIFGCKNVYFLSLMSQYIEESDVNDEIKDLHHLRGHGPSRKMLIKMFDNQHFGLNTNSLVPTFLFHWLQICQKSDVKFSKSAIEYTLKTCTGEKYEEILNQYIATRILNLH